MDTETEQEMYAVELVRKTGELSAVILPEEERKEWHDSISQIDRIYHIQASVWLLWKLYSFERDKLPAIITYEKARECCSFSEADDYIDYLLRHANNEPEILRWLETERIVRELQKKSVLCVRLRDEEALLAPRLWCRRLRNFIAAFRKNWNQVILYICTLAEWRSW